MIRFFVPGIPRPGGSKRAFRTKRGKTVVIDASKHVKDWRACVSHEAYQAMVGNEKFRGPVILEIRFHMPRPKSHYGTGTNASKLRSNAPSHHTKAPDITKLIRSTEDAMSSIVWIDDSQITKQHAEKFYSEISGAWIKVVSIPESMPGKISRIRTIAR